MNLACKMRRQFFTKINSKKYREKGNGKRTTDVILLTRMLKENPKFRNVAPKKEKNIKWLN